MIPREAFLRELDMPKAQFEILCTILWGDRGKHIASAPELEEEQGAVFVAGMLLYQYATPEQAICIMLQLAKQELWAREKLVFSVVNRVWFALGSELCWHIPTGKREDPQLPAVIESHAVDAIELFNYVVGSAASSSARAEQIRGILARQVLRSDPQSDQNDTEQPSPDHQESEPPPQGS